MEQIFHIYRTYGMEILGAILILFLAISCVQIHKINVIKKRMDGIAGQVKNYLSYVMDGEEQECVPAAEASGNKTEEERQKQHQEEEQNRLISAVLEEIFP